MTLAQKLRAFADQIGGDEAQTLYTLAAEAESYTCAEGEHVFVDVRICHHCWRTPAHIGGGCHHCAEVQPSRRCWWCGKPQSV